MDKRYEIQVVDLQEAKKSQAIWYEVTTARTLWGARRRYREVLNRNVNDSTVFFRIFDSKNRKAVS